MTVGLLIWIVRTTDSSKSKGIIMDNGAKKERGASRKRVYDFIVDFIMQNGYSPSVEEISVGSGVSSKASVHECLLTLQMMGKIDMKRNTARTIRLVGYKLVKEETANGNR